MDMARLESYNMDDRELTIEQRTFFTLRKEKELTLSHRMGGGILTHTFFLTSVMAKGLMERG